MVNQKVVLNYVRAGTEETLSTLVLFHFPS